MPQNLVWALLGLSLWTLWALLGLQVSWSISSRLDRVWRSAPVEGAGLTGVSQPFTRQRNKPSIDEASVAVLGDLSASSGVSSAWRSRGIRHARATHHGAMATLDDQRHTLDTPLDSSTSLDTPSARGRDDAVIVAIKSFHFFGDYHKGGAGCVHTDGKPLKCVYKQATDSPAPEADAVWFHLPNICGEDDPSGDNITRDAPHQLTVGMSMEPSTCYPCLDNKDFMDQFDVEMTYRRCSHVQVPFFNPDIQHMLFAEPEPFDNKLDAVAYVQSNCDAKNGRNQIVEELMVLNQLPVDAWGGCLHNKNAPNRTFDKVEVFRNYKFCIAMENSNTLDYVTEKIWHALESGCLPIYLGAPNILDFIPMANSIIDYRQFGTPEKLMAHLIMLSKDKAAYEATQKWRHMPFDSLSPGFRKLVISHGSGAVHSQCRLCQVLMSQRLSRATLTHTHCLHNQTWLAARHTKGGSTWGPGSDDLLTQPHAHRWSFPHKTLTHRLRRLPV